MSLILRPIESSVWCLTSRFYSYFDTPLSVSPLTPKRRLKAVKKEELKGPAIKSSKKNIPNTIIEQCPDVFPESFQLESSLFGLDPKIYRFDDESQDVFESILQCRNYEYDLFEVLKCELKRINGGRRVTQKTVDELIPRIMWLYSAYGRVTNRPSPPASRFLLKTKHELNTPYVTHFYLGIIHNTKRADSKLSEGLQKRKMAWLEWSNNPATLDQIIRDQYSQLYHNLLIFSGKYEHEFGVNSLPDWNEVKILVDTMFDISVNLALLLGCPSSKLMINAEMNTLFYPLQEAFSQQMKYAVKSSLCNKYQVDRYVPWIKAMIDNELTFVLELMRALSLYKSYISNRKCKAAKKRIAH